MLKMNDIIRKNPEKLIAVLVLVLILTWLLDKAVIHRRTPVLSLIILSSSSQIDTGTMEDSLYNGLKLDPSKEIVSVSLYNPSVPQTEQLLITEIRAHSADLIIGREDILAPYIQKECLMPDLYSLSSGEEDSALHIPAEWKCAVSSTSPHKKTVDLFLSYFCNQAIASGQSNNS